MATLAAIEPLTSEAMMYVSVVQLTAYLYDWVLSISGEHQVFSRAGLTWPIAIYLLSRFTTAAHLLLVLIFIFAPTGHCTPLTALFAVCAAARMISTSFLFLLRVRAVYLRSTSVTAMFGIMWLIAVILNIINDATIRAAPLTDTQYCVTIQLQHPAYPSTSAFVFDTFVFIAISYRLAADAATEQSWRARLQSVVTGKGQFSISRALMVSGQLYYLAIILFFWVNLAIVVSPLIPASSHYALNTAYFAFTNIMACRVFRGVALGVLEKSPTSAGLSSTRIGAAFELASVPAVPSGRSATSKVP
ncbi:hypothetical protein FIBSPDRAFT_1048841 [Athelia psychrophila]|uniref:G-protein coupled receptors family 1 profile domain-containing protein n=1 Tax=Athelia psychrophila TaxID=1759441 RepID=A0A166D3J8_9AGAM|nr:hypothetical protein FIBSPDRAFT_1048841 [Fibularhizoctonia sp. CBS 109695]